jgi:hypothetical protein
MTAYTCFTLDVFIIGEDFKVYDLNKDEHTISNRHFSIKMALVEACKLGDLESINELLDRGADIHANNDNALQWSAGCGYVEVVRLLLDRGANIHASNDQALRCSAENGHLEVVRLLLDRGANIHADNDEALRWSAYNGDNGHLEVLRLLLDCGANIHANDDEALRISAGCGYVEVVRLLLDRGANIHASNDEVLRWSASSGDVEVVRLLLDRGALLPERYMISTSCMNLIRIYIHDDSLFVKQCRVFGVLRRHAHSLEELCRKAILVYTRCLPDKIEEIDFELCMKTLKSMT